MNIIFQPLKDFHIDTTSSPTAYNMPFFHYHSCYELFILLSSQRTMIIQDKILQGCRGDIFLIPPENIHRTTGQKFKRIVINFSREYLNEHFNDAIIGKMLTCFDVAKISLSPAELDVVLNQCTNLFNADTSNPNNTAFLDLAKILFFLTEKMNYNFEDADQSTPDQLISNILNYVNDNYKTLHSLTEIAKHFFITKEYLCKLFKEKVEVTPISYLNSLKLKHACFMLRGTQSNMETISEECGFNSPSYFSKMFKDNFNLSPSEYRKLNSQNEK